MHTWLAGGSGGTQTAGWRPAISDSQWNAWNHNRCGKIVEHASSVRNSFVIAIHVTELKTKEITHSGSLGSSKETWHTVSSVEMSAVLTAARRISFLSQHFLFPCWIFLIFLQATASGIVWDGQISCTRWADAISQNAGWVLTVTHCMGGDVVKRNRLRRSGHPLEKATTEAWWQGLDYTLNKALSPLESTPLSHHCHTITVSAPRRFGSEVQTIRLGGQTTWDVLDGQWWFYIIYYHVYHKYVYIYIYIMYMLIYIYILHCILSIYYIIM